MLQVIGEGKRGLKKERDNLNVNWIEGDRMRQSWEFRVL